VVVVPQWIEESKPGGYLLWVIRVEAEQAFGPTKLNRGKKYGLKSV
jgi:hypothetical protein